MTLVDEARRQLDICNACRYCEGYCAVYPALERRVQLSSGDLTQLANLCHDCRACYYACMYAPPHEFALNPPQLLAQIRRESYAELVPLAGLRRSFRAPLVVALVTAALLVIIGATRGLSVLWAGHRLAASPYSVVPYPALLALGIGAVVASALLFGLGARRYFASVGPRPAHSSPWRATARALHAAATLEYLRSAGVECTYPDATESPARRRLHQGLVGGVLLTLAATIVAGIEQDLASSPPPYGVVSAPVLLGLVGGAAMLLGGGGLAVLKRRADLAPADAPSQSSDWAFLSALLVLAASGLVTLFARLSPAYGALLALHLAAVFSCFLLAPFTKFAHVVYRFLALVRDEEEREAERAALAAH